MSKKQSEQQRDAEKAERRAAQLRENLHKRKAQTRARKTNAAGTSKSADT